MVFVSPTFAGEIEDLKTGIQAHQATIADLQAAFDEKGVAINLMIEGFKATNETILSLIAEREDIIEQADKIGKRIMDMQAEIQALEKPPAPPAE